MFYEDIQIVHTVQQIIEFVGTFAFAISGIRHAAAKHFDWFGGFVCGFAVAIGGGTIRDVMLGVTPFWMTSSLYIICTVLAQIFVIVFSRSLKRLDNAWFAFDTLGLALFTIAGLQKTLACGHPFWVAIVMGCITGAAGGVIREYSRRSCLLVTHVCRIQCRDCGRCHFCYYLSCALFGCKVSYLTSHFAWRRTGINYRNNKFQDY